MKGSGASVDISVIFQIFIPVFAFRYLCRYTSQHTPQEEHPKFRKLLWAMFGLYVCMAIFVYVLPESTGVPAWADWALWGMETWSKALLALMPLYCVQLARAARLSKEGMGGVGIGGLLVAALLLHCLGKYAADVFASLSIGVLAGAVNVWIWGRR